MYSKVKRLRRGGARRSDRDIQADPGTVGHVTLATVGTNREMKVHAAGDDSQRLPAIPLLYNPQLLAMHGNRQLFAGLERQGDQNDPSAPLFMQEWAIEVLVDPPAELAETSHRPPG
jgi:hypothetical protein